MHARGIALIYWHDMSFKFNHTIVAAKDKKESATLLTERLRVGQVEQFGGRGVYFQDPAGHYLEIITRAYGSGP